MHWAACPGLTRSLLCYGSSLSAVSMLTRAVECVVLQYTLQGLRALDRVFGSDTNSKGFKVIRGAGVIQVGRSLHHLHDCPAMGRRYCLAGQQVRCHSSHSSQAKYASDCH
jgi:hypothetical protein